MPERFRVSKSEDPNLIFGKSEDEDHVKEKLLPSSNNASCFKKTSGQGIIQQ